MKQNSTTTNNDIDRDFSTLHTFSKLWPYITKHKFLLFLAIILLIISAFADTSLIGILQPLLDKGFVENDHYLIRGLLKMISTFYLWHQFIFLL
jgi:hypothetical protein